jgi:hypothetical protein
LPSYLIEILWGKTDRKTSIFGWKRRKTDQLNKCFRLKRIAAAQEYGTGRGTGPASDPLPGTGNTAPPAVAIQLLQANQKASEKSPERIDKEIVFAKTDRLNNVIAGRNEGNSILRYWDGTNIR